MKKVLENAAASLQQKKISREMMKKIGGGTSAGKARVCGCLDLDNNFYPGPSGANYCWTRYGGEPWCR